LIHPRPECCGEEYVYLILPSGMHFIFAYLMLCKDAETVSVHVKFQLVHSEARTCYSCECDIANLISGMFTVLIDTLTVAFGRVRDGLWSFRMYFTPIKLYT